MKLKRKLDADFIKQCMAVYIGIFFAVSSYYTYRFLDDVINGKFTISFLYLVLIFLVFGLIAMAFFAYIFGKEVTET